MSFPVHPPTIEWMALFGEQAPLKAPTGANERSFFIFSASLIILALLDDSLHPCKTLLSYFSLISLKQGWIRVFSLDEVGNLREEYDDDRVNDHHVQRDNNHHFSVRRSL